MKYVFFSNFNDVAGGVHMLGEKRGWDWTFDGPWEEIARVG